MEVFKGDFQWWGLCLRIWHLLLCCWHFCIPFWLLGNYKECPISVQIYYDFCIFTVTEMFTEKVIQKGINVRITASTKIEGSSSLPSVYPVKVIYPQAANTTLMTRASETDICVTWDQFFNVGSSRDPYIKKLLWWQMNAETHDS